jgi:galactonate dehydratase
VKITDVEILSADLGRIYLFVKIHTDEGIVGYGEPSCVGKERAVTGAVQDLIPFLIGANPFEIERLWTIMYRGVIWRGGPVLMAALSGVEHALWDIKGRALGVPVWELLGGRVRDRVKAYAWIHGNTPEQYRDDALARLDEGFRAIKFTPFDATDAGYSVACGKRSEARVRAAREAVGDEVAIAIDGHGVLSPINAMEMAKRIEPYGILFYEEPVLPENLDAMAEIRRVARIPIATGERLFTRYTYKDLLVKQAVDVIQADVGNAGGILEVYKIAAMAEAFYVSMAPHNPWSPLTTAISLHLDAVTQNFLIQEIPTAGAPPERYELLKQRIEKPVDGYLSIPDGPGWGVDLNEEFIRTRPWNPAERRKAWIPTGPDGALVHT